MKKIPTLLIAAAALSWAASAYAVDADAGTVASNLSMIKVAARPAAMGNAFTAMGDDINAFYANPAGLGYLRKSEAMASRFSGLGEVDANSVSLAIPLGDITSSNVRHLGVLAIGAGYVDYGRTQVLDVTGTPAGEFEGEDKILMVGWGKSFNGIGAIGLTGKLYKVSLYDEDDSGTLFDFGAMYRLIPGSLNIGAVANLGDAVSYGSTESESLSTISVGAALMPFANDRLVVTLDLSKPKDASSDVKTGVEWLPAPALALRAGYDSGFDAGSGISLGAGIILLNLEVGFFPVDRVMLDYAFTPSGDLDYSHRIALSCRIGTQ